MIQEIRTYRIAPGSLAEVEKRFGEAYEKRKKYSELTAFWHTEIGPLNEIIHVWGYRDLAERARIRAEAVKDGVWPPKIAEFIREMNSEIVNPFPFVPEVQPGKIGPDLRDPLLHAQGGHASRHEEGLGGEAARADQALAGGLRGRRRVRPAQRLRAHLGLSEPRAARPGAG